MGHWVVEQVYPYRKKELYVWSESVRFIVGRGIEVPARSLCLLWVPSLPGSGTPGQVCLPPPVLLQGSSCRGAQWSEAKLASLSLASFL